MNKILVVDDVETNRKLLRQMLVVITDCEVVEAVDGKEAITVFESEEPDLILMDINMPVMDGLKSAGEIKKIMGDNYVPIIFVTALNNSVLTSALDSGGDDFISKPFDAEVLKSKINAHLRIRELNLQLNDKNQQLAKHNEHLVHEQSLIEHFFESALNQSFLDKEIIKYHMSPMSTFNGDLLLVERGPKGGLYVLMGDFTGHGLTASMGTLPVAMIFFKMAEKGLPINNIARELNYQLNKLMPISMFFAATLIEINPAGDEMSVWMGCMPECYLMAKSNELKSVITSKHMALGVLKDNQFDEDIEVINIDAGDKLYLYSDGITEACNSEGDMFGADRFKQAVVQNGENRFDQILNELKLFTDAHDQNDDITLVEVNCQAISA